MKKLIVVLLGSFFVAGFLGAEPLPFLNRKELLVQLNECCKRDGIREFSEENFNLTVLSGISTRVDPLPENEWGGKFAEFVRGFARGDGKLALPAKIITDRDDAFRFTDGVKKEEFVLDVPRFRSISLRIFDANYETGRTEWVDIPIYISAADEE